MLVNISFRIPISSICDGSVRKSICSHKERSLDVECMKKELLDVGGGRSVESSIIQMIQRKVEATKYVQYP